MIDPQIIPPLMFGSFAWGVVAGIFPRPLGKVLLFISAIPVISFLLFISTFPSQNFTIQDISTIIPWIVENAVIFGIAIGCESGGTGLVEGFKRKSNKK